MTATKCQKVQQPRPIENLKALFEAGRSTSASRLLSRNRGSCASGALREKINLFERGYSSSSLKILNSSLRDLEELTFDDLSSRKCSLLESLSSLGSSFTAIESDSHLARAPRRGRRPVLRRQQNSNALTSEECVDEVVFMPEIKHKFERRASMGRLLCFDEDSNVWEFTETHATKRCNQEISQEDQTPKDPSNLRPRLQRRHSTGSVSVQEETNGVMESFWHVYEEDPTQSPNMPLKEKFARRRSVRFANHVTVWVFPEDAQDASHLELPQFFVKKVYTKDCCSPTKKGSDVAKQSGEARFYPNGESRAGPPNMPLRNRSIEPDDFPPCAPRRQGSNESLPQLPIKRDGLPAQPLRHVSRDESPNELASSFHDDFNTSKNTVSFSSFCDGSLGSSYSEFFQAGDSDESTIADEFSYCDEGEEEHDDDDECQTNDDVYCESKQMILKPVRFSTNGEDPYKDRRERALVWYHRWAMPSYDMMTHHVKTTPGLDITLEDVDLLPWSTTSATYRKW